MISDLYTWNFGCLDRYSAFEAHFFRKSSARLNGDDSIQTLCICPSLPRTYKNILYIYHIYIYIHIIYTYVYIYRQQLYAIIMHILTQSANPIDLWSVFPLCRDNECCMWHGTETASILWDLFLVVLHLVSSVWLRKSRNICLNSEPDIFNLRPVIFIKFNQPYITWYTRTFTVFSLYSDHKAGFMFLEDV